MKKNSKRMMQMANEKVSLISLQKEYIDSGILDADEITSYSGKSVILTFSLTEYKTLRSRYEGKNVYPRPGRNDITEGTWICTLETDRDCFVASPVCRIGPSFFLELKRSQKDEIISTLWEEHKDELIPHFKEIYAEEIENQIVAAVAEKTAELREEITLLREDKAELQKLLIENGALLKIYEGVQTQISEKKPEPVEPVENSEEVVRTGPDEITSSLFTASKYFAHINDNMTTLIIRPHDSGRAICFGNKIILTGMHAVIPFTEEYVMDSVYNPETEEIRIKLK